MAQDLVTEARKVAGREYLDALIALGFDPEGAMWTMRVGQPETLELSLFTSVVDRIGPLAVHDALFAAYDKALTPKDFDPWLVSVYSPGTMFYTMMSNVAENAPRPMTRMQEGRYEMGETRFDYDVNDRFVGMQDDKEERLVFGDWVYHYPTGKKQAATPQLKAWHRFEERIAQAA